MELNLANMFYTEPLTMSSINGWIPIPSEFVITVYLVMGTILVVAIVSHLRRGLPFIVALRKACITAFFCSGLTYLVYSENTWYQWFATDLGSYWGHTLDEKLRISNGPSFQIISDAKQYIASNDYTVRASGDHLKMTAQYYLLPKRDRFDANVSYALVLNHHGGAIDDDIYYEPRSRIIRQGSRIIENADVIYAYNETNFVMRRR